MKVFYLFLIFLWALSCVVGEGKLIKRKVLKNKNITESFTEQRRNLFRNLNKPLLKNRATDSTISKLRSRLGQALIKKNNSMIMIPVPESQRKPYTPVIMQVSKNESENANVMTYKLNKMFVPMGIYGKVVENETKARNFDLSYDVDKISITTEKVDVDKVDLTMDLNSDFMTPPLEQQPQSQYKSTFLEKFRETASNLPSLIHKGFISMSQKSSSKEQYLTHKNQDSKVIISGFKPPTRSLQGFYPATPPSFIKNEYYATATTEAPKKNSYSWKSFFGLPESTPTSSPGDMKWSQLLKKYSKSELTSAREQLYSMAEKNDFKFKSKIVNELLGMFEIVFNVGGGVSGEVVRDFSGVGDNNNNNRGSGDRSWRPVDDNKRKNNLIFSAGVSFPNKGSHYTKSDNSKYINNHIEEKGRSYYGGRDRVKNRQQQEHEQVQKEEQQKQEQKQQKQQQKQQKQQEQKEEDNSQYELVPSEIYFSEKNDNLGEIAAVVKPSWVDEDQLRQKMPLIGSVPVVEYGDGKSPSLNELQKYLTSGSLLQENKRKAELYGAKEREFVYNKEVGRRKGEGEVDLDIAELIRAQLARDEEPFDKGLDKQLDKQMDKPFDKQMKQPLYKLTYSADHQVIRPQPPHRPETPHRPQSPHRPQPPHRPETPYEPTTPHRPQSPYEPTLSHRPQISNHNPQWERSSLNHPPQPRRPFTKFFAPIPISPHTISQTLRNRYNSPVPRYVVELAKKLQRDKDVQGIVRVSTRRGSAPPVEFLYPVRG